MGPNIYHDIFNSRFKIPKEEPTTPIFNRPPVKINTGILDANTLDNSYVVK